MNIENNGGKDYFGTPLADGKTDIGAAEYVVELDKTELNALIEYAKSQQENENYQYVKVKKMEFGRGEINGCFFN